MPPRKKTVIKKKETTVAKPEGLPAPSASFGGWQSVGQTRLRRGFYNGPAQDLRRDMKPSDRLLDSSRQILNRRHSHAVRPQVGPP